jgi:hypothetical protein
MEWTSENSDTGRCFFRMSDDPGAGKSPITVSITKEYKHLRVLWAQLFINRNDARTVDPRFFFPSLAQQMSKSSPTVEYAVHETLKEQSELMIDDISIDQAQKLFVNTIRIASKSSPTSPVVIVIDALDETDFKRLAATVETLSEVLLDLRKCLFLAQPRTSYETFLALSLRTHEFGTCISAKHSIPEVTRFL